MSEYEAPVGQPVIVPASSIPESSMTLLRYALTALGGVLVSRGYLNDQTLNDVVGGLLLILPVVWGILRTKRSIAKQQTMAEQLPDSAAQIR